MGIIVYHPDGLSAWARCSGLGPNHRGAVIGRPNHKGPMLIYVCIPVCGCVMVRPRELLNPGGMGQLADGPVYRVGRSPSALGGPRWEVGGYAAVCIMQLVSAGVHTHICNSV